MYKIFVSVLLALLITIIYSITSKNPKGIDIIFTFLLISIVSFTLIHIYVSNVFTTYKTTIDTVIVKEIEINSYTKELKITYYTENYKTQLILYTYLIDTEFKKPVTMEHWRKGRSMKVIKLTGITDRSSHWFINHSQKVSKSHFKPKSSKTVLYLNSEYYKLYEPLITLKSSLN